MQKIYEELDYIPVGTCIKFAGVWKINDFHVFDDGICLMN